MNHQISGLDFKIHEMAGRIRELREIEGYTVEDMAAKTGVDAAEYIACEEGRSDLNFAFIYRCALAFNVDVTDIIEGKSPTLATYVVTRKGMGQRIEEAHGMVYHNLAGSFRNRIAEPLYVKMEYKEEALRRDIEMTTHDGQECDIVVSGTLKVQIGEHREILHAGDSIYYDSSIPHGMIAVDGEDCVFYAIVLNPSGEPIPEFSIPAAEKPEYKTRVDEKSSERIWRKFVDVEENENGTPTSITFKNEDKFNFAFDVVDALGEEKPDKLAMVYVANDGVTDKRLTFKDMKQGSAQCANYFKSLGIKKGDTVMLVLKRHYQFWYAMLGLNKLGAIAIPATCQLVAHDFEYRFNAAHVTAVICTADGDTANQIDMVADKCPELKTKIMVNGTKEGWHDFNEESVLFTRKYVRTEDAPAGDDPLLAFFTSGTTGYPKIAIHNHKYPLGHFHTAKYWHCVDPEGIHFTISETGWAKSMWGKLYGQWLCEAATFVFDFDRFDAAQILPMFEKYHITTFCAPPTMYRMLIKDDLSKYSYSSLQHATTAGEALNPEVFKQFEAATGLKIMEGFGQSETTCLLGNLVGASHKVGSMGKPCPIYDVHLVDPDGADVGVGETGEIVIRTADKVPCGLFMGYYLDEEKTAEAWYDGYYHTGDLAWRDEDGFFWYVGRKDDVIKSSGYRIGPFEIENVIMELPYVLECGVSAAPDPVRGQVVKASIVLTRGTEPTDELKKEIQEYVKKNTAPYKYPRIVVFCTELPKTVSGKIIRNKL
ncbi:MAG: cupin domain-containing protein [Ruminococcaceae bacterium]|nr:cupin domain-containing protein [Oscillospiraceae bacterium]